MTGCLRKKKFFFRKLLVFHHKTKKCRNSLFSFPHLLHLHQPSFLLEFRYFGLYSPLFEQFLVFLFFFFFILNASSHTIDISINISSSPCTKGYLFGRSSLTSAVMIAPYCKVYQIYRDNSRGTGLTIERASFPGNSVFPATANLSTSLSNSR